MTVYSRFARVYDALMADVDRAAWAEYILSFLPRPGLAVADAACGTGALTIPLARAGHRVTGIDASEDMLFIASEKARLARLDIPFICERMEHLSLHRKMDAIVSACDGVNYLSSRAGVTAFFDAAMKNLAPGGLLIFDISSRYKLSHILGNNTFTAQEDEAAYIWQNEYDEANRLIRMDVTFFEKAPDGRYERFSETHIQRAHSVREITAWLASAGFTDIRVYGAFTHDAPEEECERIQFVAAAPERG